MYTRNWKQWLLLDKRAVWLETGLEGDSVCESCTYASIFYPNRWGGSYNFYLILSSMSYVQFYCWTNEVIYAPGSRDCLGSALSPGRLLGQIPPWTVQTLLRVSCGQAACMPPAPISHPLPHTTPFGFGSMGVSWRRFYSWWKVVSTWDGPQKKKVWASCFHCDSGRAFLWNTLNE